ncbi:MAG: hypothetical protein JSV78_03975 [Phycisphaerales bacterium]|nr:MAG: hypothetical protein JSV78_03975 [Phycisphaerales bacterium]
MGPITLLTACMLSISSAPSIDLPVEFSTDDGFTLYLPEGWVEIPSHVLDQYSQTMHELAPEIPARKYDYGYQPQPDVPGTWLIHPYVIVQIKRVGRLPENEMRNHKWLDKQIEREKEQVEQKMSKVITVCEPGETVYEPRHRILWMRSTLDARNSGRITYLTAMRLTNFGFIQLNMYSTAQTFDDYEPVYKQIATSMALDSEIEYQPKFTDNFPLFGSRSSWRSLKIAIRYVAFAAIALLFLYVMERIKKASRRT